MFERFTERARQIVVLAQEEARKFGSDKIGVEHLFLACYTEEEGAAARVLRHLNVNENSLRDLIPFGSAGKRSGQQLPFTATAKSVLEQALREALALGHSYIGTEHILLGIVRVDPLMVKEATELDPTSLREEITHFVRPVPFKVKPMFKTISFNIELGQVWVDPNEIAWDIKHIDGETIHLERTNGVTVDATDLVRTYRLADG